MKTSIRIVAAVLAVGAVGMYVYTAVTRGGTFAWMNAWMMPAMLLVPLAIAAFVLTMTRSGTRGSVLDNLQTALAQPTMTDPVEGVARVVTASGMPRSGQNMGSAMCELNLVITVPGQPSVAASTASIVKLSQWPTAGVQLPVVAERSNPSTFRILWERVGTGWDTGRQQAQALADQMNAAAGHAAQTGTTPATNTATTPTTPLTIPGFPIPPGAKLYSSVVSVNGHEATPEEIATYEAITGMDLNGDGVVGQPPAPQDGSR